MAGLFFNPDTVSTVATALQALLYRSRIVNRLGPLHMLLLVERARHANLAHGITGQLVYFDHCFMQYLEGPGPALDELWNHLQRDPRHYEVELLTRYPLTRRRLSGSPLMFLGKAYFRDTSCRTSGRSRPWTWTDSSSAARAGSRKHCAGRGHSRSTWPDRHLHLNHPLNPVNGISLNTLESG